MKEYKEYYLPTTTEEKAQYINISEGSRIKIDNEKIQEFLDKVVSQNRLSNSMYKAFILFSILTVAYLFHFASLMISTRSHLMLLGLFLLIIISLICFIVASVIDRKWSADELHIIPIKDYEFKDDNTKLLCTTS